MTESSLVLYGEYLVGGYIPVLSLVLVHSSLYTQSSSSSWARCPKAQMLLLNLDKMVSVLWEFMLVRIFNMPSSLCFEKGGGLVEGYEHSDKRARREASVKGRSWSRLRRKMWPSTKIKADKYFRVSVRNRGQQIPPKETESKALCVDREDSSC